MDKLPPFDDFLNGEFAQALRKALFLSPTEFAKALAEYKSLFVVEFEKVLSGNIEKSPEGFFKKTATIQGEIMQRAYMYMPRYYVQTYKGAMPKYHLFQCEAVKTFTGFVWGNAELVDIVCRDTGKEHTNKMLEPCKYCATIFHQKTALALTGKTFQSAILDLAEKATQGVLTRSDGYATNWADISSAYRYEKKYTCEHCKLSISDKTNQHFMETHHKNGNKLDNKRTNFQCLCVLCHATIDVHHLSNYSDSLTNRTKVSNFIQLFGSHIRTKNTSKLAEWNAKNIF